MVMHLINDSILNVLQTHHHVIHATCTRAQFHSSAYRQRSPFAAYLQRRMPINVEYARAEAKIPC